MNKLLLGTTALVGASILMAGAAYAAKPKVTVKAYVKFEVLGSSQDLEAITGNAPNRGYGFATDSEVTVEGDGVTDAGMKWKAHIEMETDAGSSGNDETWIRFSGSWGQINLGSEDGAEDLMQHGAQKAHTAGDGGVDGDWVDAIDWNAVNGRLVPSAKLDQDSSDAVKATYFTPRVGGLQLGVSFTPDTDTKGRSISGDQDGKFESSWGIGVNFVKKIGGANVAISAVGHIAESEVKKTVTVINSNTSTTTFSRAEDLRAWAVGASVGYGNWRVGANYQDNGDGGESTGGLDSTSFAVGVGYSQGPVNLGVSYLHSEVEDSAGGEDEGDAVVVGATYSLGGGASVYGDFFWFDTEDQAGVGVNDGVGFLIGTAVKF